MDKQPVDTMPPDAASKPQSGKNKSTKKKKKLDKKVKLDDLKREVEMVSPQSALAPAWYARSHFRRHRLLQCSPVCLSVQGRRSLWDRGDTSPPIFGLGGHYHEYFWSNISYFLSMQYFLDKLKEFLVLILEVSLVSVSGQCCGVSSD